MLRCNVCGKSDEEVKINVHCAMGMPVSCSYCEECDSKGFITEWELIRYIASSDPAHKKFIVEHFEHVQENARLLANNRYLYWNNE